MKLRRVIAVAVSIPFASAAVAQKIGEVDTEFKLIGPGHKIVVEAFDDPKIAGITCYVSRSKTGGLKGAFCQAEEKSESSIACRQVGPISATVPIPKSEEVFSESRSILFKKMRIVRVVDPERQVLLYPTYTDKLIDGSPKNSLTAVPLNGAKLQFK